jgi:hypothetical protein
MATNFQKIDIRNFKNSRGVDIGIAYYYTSKYCLIKKIIPYSHRIIIESAHVHPFQEDFYIDDLCNTLMLEENEPQKLDMHEIFSNGVYSVKENVPHQLLLTGGSVCTVTNATVDSMVNASRVNSFITESSYKRMMKEVAWLHENKRFMEEIHDLIQSK